MPTFDDVLAPRKERPDPILELEDRYRREDGRLYLTGIQASVRVILDQIRADRRKGLVTAGFVSGYPGSPLGNFDRELAGRQALLDEHGVVHQAGLNEELAATAVMGSQTVGRIGGARHDGVLGVWYAKAPGLDRATDAIRHANYFGVAERGGVLAFVGDDPSAKSSSLPSGSEQALAEMNIPVLSPGTTQEILDFGLHGFALSRFASLWVGMKIVTLMADGTGTADVTRDRISPIIPLHDPELAVPVVRPTNTGLTLPLELERNLYEVRLELARAYAAANDVNQITVDPPSARVGIAASGHTYYEVVEALRRLGLDESGLRAQGVRLLRIGMPYPLDGDIVRRFSRGLGEVIVVEEKRAFLELHIRDALYGTTDAPVVTGKTDPSGQQMVRAFNNLDADTLLEPLYRRLVHLIDPTILRAPAPVAALASPPAFRTPYFCSGCPHNTSVAVPEGALVGAGIGCHGMAVMLSPTRVGKVTGMTQMGGEGAQWLGIAPFVDADHLFQNLGDGTFFHSGQLAVQAAVAAGVTMTFKLLFNGGVAMTGGQAAVGSLDVPTVARILKLQGVRRIIVTTDDLSRYRKTKLPEGVEVWDRNRLVEAQEELRAINGVTVLIHDQQCAAEARRLRKRGLQPDPTTRMVIAERVCEGCGDCGVKSNCLSVQPVDTEFGRKTQIDQTSCNKDYTCRAGDCPAFISFTASRRRRTVRAGAGPLTGLTEVGGWSVPEPTAVVAADDYTIRMPGIGGTGVVTVAQVLGTAAQLDGLDVSGADQTGMSQKAGPVVSDLHLSREPVEGTNTVLAGACDLYLVFDVLVGLMPNHLLAADPNRTVAVVSTARVATGQMVADPAASFPDEAALHAALDARTRADRNLYLDPHRIATALFGSTTSANMVLLGAAYQQGLLPVRAASIEQAIEMNGAAVEMNRLAFRSGRMWVADPDRVLALLNRTQWPAPPLDPETKAVIGELGRGTELGRLLGTRAADLVRYQNRAYAHRYVSAVREVARTEERVRPGSTELAEAAARYLYKLMAYKDEYEVARLHLEPYAGAQVAMAAQGAPVKAHWNLHPPTLKALGLDRKLRLGPWFRPGLRMLAAMKRLRGTPLDPFGRTAMRRLERQLISEYQSVVGDALGALTEENFGEVVALASLPEQVRGYESVKSANVERYRTELDRRCAALGIARCSVQ